ncbi:MAG: arginine deiminase [Clostridiales bacterium]|nr:arginine deiminase [Clostridiales bacterium]
MKGINVKSEIGTLKKVLLHRPGRELLNLTPNTLGELLFDDIPFLKMAQAEHDAFAKTLSKEGVEVVYIEDLVTQIFDKDSEIKKKFLEQFIIESGVSSAYFHSKIYDYLCEKFTNNKDLVLKTVEGINIDELKIDKTKHLSAMVADQSFMIVKPMPNLYFTRDPFASIGDGVSVHKMYSVTRNRETIYAEYLFKYHPDFKDSPQYYNRYLPFRIEGGDVMIINNTTIAVGISQRTEADAIEVLAKQIFATNKEIINVLAIIIPSSRAFMHLDTVFTQIDRDKFVAFKGAFETIDVCELTKSKSGDGVNIKKATGTLEEILEKYVGKKVEIIPCAGGNRINAEREQWNDGSNILTIAPGKVVVYDRNDISNSILKERGIKLHEIPSAELSRGRGGPRCMSMPLFREDLK